MGNSMEETMGMLVAITEQTRSASRSARALNTIFARVTSVLDENSTTGSAVAKIFDDLGISMYDASGQIRDTYDLLGDLSTQWVTLDTNTQNYIAQTLAGKIIALLRLIAGNSLEYYILSYYRNIIMA